MMHLGSYIFCYAFYMFSNVFFILMALYFVISRSSR